MLAVSERAAGALESVVSASHLPDTTGLRISRGAHGAGEQTFALSFVEAPEPSDEVVADQAVPVFPEREAAELLDDKLLDAYIDEGRVQFVLAEHVEPAD